MSAAAILDVEDLLRPISEERPAGEDPRDDDSAASLYYRAKGARAAARSAERAATGEDGGVADEWWEVADAAASLLSTQAKDLEAAAWLAEALVRMHGFAGFRDAFQLMAGLVELYWDDLYPLPDEDGLETRLAAVTGLNGSGGAGTLNQPLQTTPIFGSDVTFSFWQYTQTNEFSTIVDEERREARMRAGVRTPDEMREAMATTSGPDLRATLATVEECEAALARLTAALDERAGYDAPSTSALRDILQNIAAAIRHLGGEKAVSAPAGAMGGYDDAAAEDDGAVADHHGGAPSFGGVRTSGFRSREEALDAVTAVAEYFRRTEPQAMIAYTLDDAVRRARLTLPELLLELTEDPSQIRAMLMAAGVRVSSEGE